MATLNNRRTPFVKKKLAETPALVGMTDKAAQDTKFWIINSINEYRPDVLEAAEMFVIRNLHHLGGNKFTAMNLANDILRELGQPIIFNEHHKWAGLPTKIS